MNEARAAAARLAEQRNAQGLDEGGCRTGPDAKDWDEGGWRARAACRGQDPELFFPIGTSGPAQIQIAEAKAVCARCPVREACLRFALDTGQEYGIWGGLTEDERQRLRRGRREQHRSAAA